MELEMAEFVSMLIAILAVGIALAALILRTQHSTNQRIDGLGARLVEVEKGQARLEGYLAGLQTHHSQSSD